MNYLAVPLALHYDIAYGSLALSARAGLQANFLLNQQIETEFDNGFAREKEILNNIDGMKKGYISALLGISTRLSLSDHFAVVFMPEARFGLSSINRDAPVRSYNRSFGLMTGLQIAHLVERKAFLKNGIMAALGLTAITPLAVSCSKENITGDGESGGTGMSTGNETGTGTCTTSPSETAGPFPTKSPSSLVNSDIRSDRTGVPLTVKLTINNKNNSCAALAGAIVDIWHCDKDGYYSEYGGSGMQSVNLTSVHFLRGRQTSDANGLVTFTTIFPGWYAGRAPHIHVHIYDASGTSLLVTQIAFPTDVGNTVYTTATNYYTRGTQDTSNARDNVFADSLASELATVSGSVANGYVPTHLITVAA